MYNPTTNPDGVRCTSPTTRSRSGAGAPRTGSRKRPLDNVGVQYGLNALNSGLITAEQFVDLNEKIGGVDIDLNFQPERSAADPGSLAIAYGPGR